MFCPDMILFTKSGYCKEIFEKFLKEFHFRLSISEKGMVSSSSIQQEQDNISQNQIIVHNETEIPNQVKHMSHNL